MFLASNCTCAVYFTYTAHVQLPAKNMAATHVHAFAYAFAYAIKQTPYAFVSKIILCMYLLYAPGIARQIWRVLRTKCPAVSGCILGCIAYLFNRGVDTSQANLLKKALRFELNY